MDVDSGDRAGVAYWDDVWSARTKSGFNPVAVANRPLTDLLSRFLRVIPRHGFVVEAGCGDSVVMPYIHGLCYRTAGIDYSAPGCAKFRRNAPQSAIYQADIFDPPPHLRGHADGVFSLGLVEHFDDTEATIAALARLVTPGGYLLTVIPNMRGTVGALQRLLNPRAFAVHLPLAPAELVAAHSGIKVIEAGYLGSTSYGVVNPGKSALARSIVGILARVSLVAMSVGYRRPTGMLSPYCYCLARVPAHHG